MAIAFLAYTFVTECTKAANRSGYRTGEVANLSGHSTPKNSGTLKCGFQLSSRTRLLTLPVL